MVGRNRMHSLAAGSSSAWLARSEHAADSHAHRRSSGQLLHLDEAPIAHRRPSIHPPARCSRLRPPLPQRVPLACGFSRGESSRHHQPIHTCATMPPMHTRPCSPSCSYSSTWRTRRRRWCIASRRRWLDARARGGPAATDHPRVRRGHHSPLHDSRTTSHSPSRRTY